MIDGRDYTARQLADIAGTTTRNLYYLLHALTGMGFRVIHEGRHYRLDPQSEFFRHMTTAIDLSDDEANYLYGLLENHGNDTAISGMLRRKISRYYHIEPGTGAHDRRRIETNINILEQAIDTRRVVILHDYASGHSRSISDRVVEPFAFQGDRTDIRAFEIKTKLNKTFKIARIQSVELVDTPWFNEARHREAFTDLFMFSGEERHFVRLRLSMLAHRLLLEEYPHSRAAIHPESTDTWIFETEVANYVGIGRFILGQYDEIEVLDDDGLRTYLRNKVAQYAERKP